MFLHRKIQHHKDVKLKLIYKFDNVINKMQRIFLTK